MRYFVLVVLALVAVSGIATGLSFVSANQSTSKISHGPFPLLLATAGSSMSYAYVGASTRDSSALPNTGVRTTIQVISEPISQLLSFWASDTLSNNLWAQVGYYLYQSSTPVAVYEIWDLTTNTRLATGTASVSVGTHQFSLWLQSGTIWAFALDGHVFGTYNMGTSVSSSTAPVRALSEEGYTTSPFPFSDVAFTSAIEVLNSGTWHQVQTGTSWGTAWGVYGNLQNTDLANDQIVISSSVPSLQPGTQLWSSLSSSSGSDTIPPSVSIASPSNGAFVSGVASVTVSATDNVGVTKVELYADGALFGTVTLFPYTFGWDSGKYTDGSHSLVAKAYDSANNIGTSSTVFVTVDNTAPTVAITSPAPGAKVSGRITISASASDSSGIKMVQFYIDGKLVTTMFSGPYQYSWRSNSAKSGSHTILVIAYDNAGNNARALVSVVN